jgi:hypothetical protein
MGHANVGVAVAVGVLRAVHGAGPFLTKNEMHAGGSLLGETQAAFGAGAGGHFGVPRRNISVMCVVWAAQSPLPTAYALRNRAILFVGIAFGSRVCGGAGNVIWASLIKTRVPGQLLGRVSSIDWFTSLALVPVSYAMVRANRGRVGCARVTLLAAGMIAAAMQLVFLRVPGVRNPERLAADPATAPAQP